MGFQHLPKDKLSEISRKGAKAGKKNGTSHSWTPAEAKAAGLKGGAATAAKKAAAKNGSTPAAKDPKRQVKVNCVGNAGGGCVGTAPADQAGGDYAGEIAPTPTPKPTSKKKSERKPAKAAPPSDDMGGCGHGTCSGS
jgi:general stress protein YciG